MAEGLLLFYYFPNTSQSASLTAPLKGSLPQCLPDVYKRQLLGQGSAARA